MVDYQAQHAQLLDMLGAKDHEDAARIIAGHHARDLAQEKAEPVAEGMQPSRPKPHMPVGLLGIEDFCFCNNEVSLQSVSGGGSSEGYLGSVQIKVDGKFVTYVRKDVAPPAERVRVPDGMKLVPLEPTEAMVTVNTSTWHPADAAEIYKAMLSAAPEADHG